MQGNRSIVLLAVLLVAVVGVGVWLGLRDSRPETSRGGTSSGVAPRPEAEDVAVPAVPARKEGKAGHGRGRITGRVVLFKTREPVADVVVHLAGGLSDFEARDEVTGRDGRFTFAELPAGEGYEVTLAHGEFAPVRRPDLTVLNAELTDLGDLFLEHAVSFLVRVVDGREAPVAGASVRLYSSRGRTEDRRVRSWLDRMVEATRVPSPLSEAKADEKGEVRFSGLPAGYYSIAAVAPGYAVAGAQKTISPETAAEPVVIRLGKGFALSGTVSDTSGKPVEGTVLILPSSTSFSWGATFLRMASELDGEGRYRFANLPPGSATLMVVPKGRPAVPGGTVAVPDMETYDIVLGEGAVLEGTVTDKQGKPVPGAEVRALISSPRGGQGAGCVAVSDEEGKYRLEGIPAGSVNSFEVLAEGYARYPPPGAVRQQIYVSAGTTVRADVELIRGLPLTGRVTRESDGKALAGAVVVVMPRGAWGGMQESATADGDGKYGFASLAPGEYALQVTAEGFYQDKFPNSWQVRQPQFKLDDRWKVRLEEGVEDTVKDLVLKEGGTVSGRLEDSNGKPVPGVSVWVSGQGRGRPAVTDKDGNWTVRGLKEGTRLYASAWLPGRWARSDPFSLSPGGRVEGIVLTLKATARIEGVVELQDGGLPEGGYAWWVNGDPRRSPWLLTYMSGGRVPVGDDGSFKLEGVNPGQVTVIAMVPGYPPAWSETRNLSEGDEALGVRVRIEAGFALCGVVRMRNGEPVEKAEIGITAQSSRGYVPGMTGASIVRAQTDAGGKFVVRGLPKSKYRVTARKEGLTPATQNGIDPSEGAEVVLEMEEGGEISGRVLDEQSRPVPGLRVYLQREKGTRNRGALPQTTTQSDGTFRLRGVPEGSYKVLAGPAWGSRLNYTTGEATGARPGDPAVTIRVEPGYRISGKALDPEGQPAAGYQVSVVSVRGKFYRSMQTKADGSFEFTGVPEGNYTVRVDVWGGGMAPVSLSNVPAGTENLLLQLSVALTIEGYVADVNGAPIRSVQVRATPMPGSQGGSGYGRTDSNGHYRMRNLPAGNYRVRFTAPGRFAPEEITDVPAGSTGISLVMVEGNTISGLVVDVEGNPRPGVSVMATPVGGGSGVAAGTNGKGEFTIKGLGDGDYGLSISARRGGYMLPEPVIVAAGAKAVKLVVVRGLAIAGVVTDSRGGGIANAWVSVVGGGRWIQTKSDGSFRIEGVEPGKVRLRVWANDRQKTVEAEAGDESVQIRIE